MPDRPTTSPDRPTGFLSDEALAKYEDWLDSHFHVFGMRFGLDGLIGLIPGIGDLATTGISSLFVADAVKMGARKRTIARMIGNIGIDFTLGAIPVVGDVFDFAFKSNTKNLRLLRAEREHLHQQKLLAGPVADRTPTGTLDINPTR